MPAFQSQHAYFRPQSDLARRLLFPLQLKRGHWIMELTQEQVFIQEAKRDQPGFITENAYQEGQDKSLFYHSTRNRGRCCLVCKHWTAPRDLRQERRWLVVLANGHCRLGERTCVEGRTLRALQQEPHACTHACPKFEKIPELRARNMTMRQRAYAGMPPCKTGRRKNCDKRDCPMSGSICN